MKKLEKDHPAYEIIDNVRYQLEKLQSYGLDVMLQEQVEFMQSEITLIERNLDILKQDLKR